MNGQTAQTSAAAPIAARRPRLARPSAAHGATPGAVPGGIGGAFTELFQGVDWSLSFIGVLYYFFVITTYWLKGADIAVVVAGIGLVLRIDSVRFDAVMLWFAAFVVWCLVAYMTSPYQGDSWPQTWEIVKMWIVTFIAINVMRTRENVRFFLAFAVACFMLFPARGAFINYFGGYSVWGRALWNFAYSNPNDLAAYALVYASFAAALFFEARNKVLRLAALSSVGVLFALVFFTQSRGALLAAALVVGSFVFFRLRNPRVVLGALAMVVVAGIVAPKSVWERLGGLAGISLSSNMKGVDREGSAEQRFQIMKVAVDVAKANPITGVGPGAYPMAHGTFSAARSDLPTARGRRDAHNTYLRTAAETGMVGLSLFLLLVTSTLYAAWRASRKLTGARRDMIRMLSYGLIAYMLAGMFGSFTYLNVLYLDLMLLSTVSGFAVASARSPRAAVVRRGARQVRGAWGGPQIASPAGARPQH